MEPSVETMLDAVFDTPSEAASASSLVSYRKT
jgi:hypothetical protein